MICIWVSMFSQMRGGASMESGPSSRRSRCTVSGFSGQLAVSRATSAMPSVKAVSPSQAIGRYDSQLSPGLTSFTSTKASAVAIRLRWLSIAPLGLPVVPEV